jgi:ABC-type phosphate/phosphonate transport system substrate-binding protein
MLEALDKQEIDMATLRTLDYLRMKKNLYMEPFFVTANQVKDGQQRLLIVRKDRGITKVTQLKDRIVNAPSRLRDEISFMWLDILLAREGIAEREKFFQQVRETNKASQAVLPVFFKQIDSALVKRSGFEMISTLNPQLKEDLFILANSKSFLGDVFCVRKNLDESLKRALIEKAPTLHETPSGKQMFTLLQVDRIIPFQPSYLDNLVELEREYNHIS